MSNRFGGGSDKLSTALDSALTIGTGAFSLGVWLKRMSDSNDFAQVFVVADAASGPSNRIGFEFDEDGTTLHGRFPTGYLGLGGYDTAADTWYWCDITRSGTTIRIRVFDTSAAKVHDATVTNSTDYSGLDTIIFGNTGNGLSAFDGEAQLGVVQTGVAWSDAQSWAQAQKFGIQLAGGTDRFSWGLETITADQFGLNEYSGSGEDLSNTGVVSGASRPSPLESAGGSANEGAGTVPYSYAVSGTGAGQTIGNGTVPYSYAVSGTGAGQTIGNGTVPYSYAVSGTGAGQTIGNGTVPYRYAVAGSGAVGVTSADGVVPYSYAVSGTGFSAGEAPTGAYAAYSQDLQRRLAEWAAKQSPQAEPRKRRKRAAKVAPNPTFDVFVPEAKVAPFPERAVKPPPEIVRWTGKGRAAGPGAVVRGAGYVNRWSPDDDAAALLLLMNAAAA